MPDPNRIHTPQSYHIKVAITLDPNLNQSEMKIINGKITNIQLAALLMEHATNIVKQLMMSEAKMIANESFGKVGQPNNGGDNNAA